MVKKEVEKIDVYSDLKKVFVGDLISIKGKTPEIVINPLEEFKNYRFSKDKEYKKSDIYTIGIEGPFLVQNQYTKYKSDSDEFLIPYFKISCKIGSSTSLENALSKIVEREDLLKSEKKLPKILELEV